MGLACWTAFIFASPFLHAEETPTKPAPEPDRQETPAKSTPKPDRRTWNIREGAFLLTFEFDPGIPEAGKVVEITAIVSEIPNQPHPQYGNNIPIHQARIEVQVEDPSGKAVGRYLTHAQPRAANRYALHVTPQKQGIHTLVVEGTTEDGRKLSARVKMPVDVWPLPAELSGTGADAVGQLTGRRPIIKK